MTDRLDKWRIKEALAYVHFNEREMGRVNAAAYVIRTQRLSTSEGDILLNALNVRRDEIQGIK